MCFDFDIEQNMGKSIQFENDVVAVEWKRLNALKMGQTYALIDYSLK